MLRKILVCLGASFVLTVVAIMYSAGIPTTRGDTRETFESVARELRKGERAESRRAAAQPEILDVLEEP